MASSCFIGIKNYGEYITGIRCSNFGQPSITGDLLIKHYNDFQKAALLIRLGDIMSLGERLYPEPLERHSYDHPCDGVTVAYHRDMGDQWSPLTIRMYLSENDAYDSMDDIDWMYIFEPDFLIDTHRFDKGTWYCAKVIRDFYDPYSDDVYLGDGYLSKPYPLETVLEEGEDIFEDD